MATHVKVLAVLFIVWGALGLLAGGIGTLVLGGLATAAGASHDSDALLGSTILGLTGMALLIFTLVTSIPCIICGIGLLKFKRWARILGIVLAALTLIHFPIGTAFGVYALYVFFQKDTEALLTA
jgi:hypothetical protein